MDTSKLACGACGTKLLDGACIVEADVVKEVSCPTCSTIHALRYSKDSEGNMVVKAVQGEAGGTTATRPELLEKLRRLSESEADVSAQKKGEVAAFNDQLKDIREEKKTVLAALKKVPGPEGK